VKKKTEFILFLIIFLMSNLVFSQEKYVIKFATLAPEGSTWIEVLDELNDEIKEKTNNQMRFKIYPGGQQGDELNVVRKMRFDQIHCAGFTGKGMGDIQPESRVLELPFLFNNVDEYDYVMAHLFDYFYKLFEEKGFIFLGNAEVGFVYIFSNIPISSPDDMKKAKMWMWEGDPLVEETYKTFGVTPVPLPITDVLTSLQTNLIDAFYNSPLATIALQWFTRVKYMNGLPLTNGAGVVLLQKKYFDKLPSEFQNILKESCKKHLRRLVLKTREENERAISALQKSGITVIDIEDEAKIDNFKELGFQVQQNLVGKLYSRKTLDLVKETLNEYRTKQVEK